MPQLGNLALAIALILAVYSIVANIYGARSNSPDFVVSARHALWAMCAMVTIAMLVLWSALLRSDFSLEYVASYSSTTLPTVYKITSLWGGQQGSLMFWTWLLSIFTSIAAFQNRRRNPEIEPYALAVLASVATRHAPASINFRSDFARLNAVSPRGMKHTSDSPRIRK